ncbi:MAG TPA: alpha/beta hydrolase [Candidatus Angelobacter sp.]
MKTRREMCVFILWLMLAPLVAWLGSTTVHAARSAQAPDRGNITGEWQGAIAKLHLSLKIDQAADGTLAGKLISVDQGNVTIAIDVVSVDPSGAVRLELKSIGAVYEGKLSDAGAEIAGTWQQGGNSLSLAFRRPGAAAPTFTLKPRTMGRVPLEPCRSADGNTEGVCGKYEVYENRQSQSGRKIALNIMVLPALAEKPAADPFFPLAGGPGQSAVEAFPLAGYTAKVRKQRDVVLVDQRGTGNSNLLPCELRGPNDAQAILGLYLPEEKLRTCRAELEKQADLTQYTTSISADDLDEVRQALGYDKINVFGGSYGTRAALVYLRQHGDHVRTLTLEGVAPPQYRIPLAFSRTIQGSVDQLIARCAADEACHKDFPDLKKEFQAILDRLDKSPAQFEVKTPGGNMQQVTLTRSQFVAGLRPLLYVPGLASHFPYMVHRAYQGDWTHYGTPAVAIRAAIEKEIARGMATSVICAEDIPGLSEATIRRQTKGTYLGDFQVRAYQKVCREWPQGKIPSDFHAAIHSKVPTLLISGALDPATPPEASAQAARDLSNSRVVVVKEGTHGTGSPCIDGLISQFVAQGSPSALDASCVDQIHLPPFLTQSQIDQRKGNNTAR